MITPAIQKLGDMIEEVNFEGNTGLHSIVGNLWQFYELTC